MASRSTFATTLKRLRIARGLTQAELGELAGTTLQSIHNYENGARWPQPDVLDVLAKVLKVRPWQLLANEGEGAVVPPELVDHVAAAARACGLKVSAR